MHTQLSRLSFILILFLTMQTSLQAQTDWSILNTSKVTFKIKNAGFNVDGSFSGLSGSMKFSTDALAKSSITTSLPAKTINTGINARDNHLRKDDYFGVEKYPNIKMVSEKFEKTGNSFIGYFKLTIRDVTKSIKIPFSFEQNNDEATFKGSFQINRRDYNVGGWSMILGNEVDIDLLVKVKKK